MRKMKRVPFLALALVLFLSLSVPAFAADNGFTIVDGVLTEYTGPGGNVTIPNGVTKIGIDAFYMRDDLTSVVIPDSVTEIGDGAFGYCFSITNIAIPSSVTQIGSAAFEHCDSLTTVTIPGSVTAITDGAFVLCYGLTNVTICDGVTEIGSSTFFSCENLTDVTIPDSVITIGADAFGECNNLTIHGKQGSYAERYAKENNIPFVADGASQPTVPSFTDVSADGYYADAVKWAVGHEPAITNGTTETTFEPDTTCTQAQILTFLWRAAGKPEITDKVLPFEVDEAYRGAVLWADDMGMIDRGTFDPSAPCTRSAAVRFIWQAFLSPEAEEAAGFTDVSADADYAAAVSWAVANGITNGTDMDAGLFSPDEICSRGHIVTFLYRAYIEQARLTVD